MGSLKEFVLSQLYKEISVNESPANDQETLSPLTSTASTRTLTFDFRGDGMEYFKIWIVNILLTIVTLGIYSAWATVRSNRYFYANTYLDESNFQYLAEPLTILKGRLMAVGVFILISMASWKSSMVGAAMTVVILLAIPYLVNQSLAFQLRNTAYKNIQFRFKATYLEAFMVFYIWPIAGMLTLGILYPLALLKMNQYMVKNSAYGTTKFDFNATFKDYGVIFLTLLGAGLVLGLVAFLLATYVFPIPRLAMTLYGLVYVGLIIYFIVATFNLFYLRLSLTEHGFTGSISMAGYTKTVFINLFLILVTIGLYLPAAKVRMTKYIASCVKMETKGSLDDFVAAEKESVSAFGEEFSQVMDFSS